MIILFFLNFRFFFNLTVQIESRTGNLFQTYCCDINDTKKYNKLKFIPYSIEHNAYLNFTRFLY